MDNYLEKNLMSNLHQKLEDLVIEGLKRKGFEFKNNLNLEDFVKTRCRREDNFKVKEHIYYVDDIPFLLYNYDPVYEEIKETHKRVQMSVTYGTYKYL